MKDVASVAAVICVCCALCSVVGVLVPQGSTKRILNSVLGVFIVCALIVPIKTALNGFELDIKSIPEKSAVSSSADEIYNNQVIKQTEKNLNQTLKKLLADEKIYCKTCGLKLKTNEDGGIYIKSISIYLYKNADKLKASQTVKENFGIKPRIFTV